MALKTSRTTLVWIQKQYDLTYYGWEARGKRNALYEYSNPTSIASKINCETDYVIDIGCSANYFKKIITNLYGIDVVYNPRIDEHVSIEDFKPAHKFDVALCLGSINFDSKELVEAQTKKLTEEILHHKSKIFWRCCSETPRWDEEKITYLWTMEDHTDLSEKFGYKIDFITKEKISGEPGKYRIYAEWSRG
jgi:hypothetical protein